MSTVERFIINYSSNIIILQFNIIHDIINNGCEIMNIDPEVYGRIVCAALLHNNCIYMGKEGHHVIFPMEPLGVLRCAIQGFVTEYGYFVDREIGLYIASYFDQINVKYNPKDKLVSEDLKKENLKALKYIKEYSYKEKQKKKVLHNLILEEIKLFMKKLGNLFSFIARE